MGFFAELGHPLPRVRGTVEASHIGLVCPVGSADL